MELCEVKLFEKKNFFFKTYIIYLTLQTDLACKIRPARASRTPFDYQIIKKWSQEMISGIAFLHKTYDMKSEIIHRDIKPGFVFFFIIILLLFYLIYIVLKSLKYRNILLKNGQIKIADLGLAKEIDVFTRADTALGTLCYMSPEMIVLKNEMRKGAGARIEITTKADIW